MYASALAFFCGPRGTPIIVLLVSNARAAGVGIGDASIALSGRLELGWAAAGGADDDRDWPDRGQYEVGFPEAIPAGLSDICLIGAATVLSALDLGLIPVAAPVDGFPGEGAEGRSEETFGEAGSTGLSEMRLIGAAMVLSPAREGAGATDGRTESGFFSRALEGRSEMCFTGMARVFLISSSALLAGATGAGVCLGAISGGGRSETLLSPGVPLGRSCASRRAVGLGGSDSDWETGGLEKTKVFFRDRSPATSSSADPITRGSSAAGAPSESVLDETEEKTKVFFRDRSSLAGSSVRGCSATGAPSESVLDELDTSNTSVACPAASDGDRAVREVDFTERRLLGFRTTQ
jgi:hypothetical protein